MRLLSALALAAAAAACGGSSRQAPPPAPPPPPPAPVASEPEPEPPPPPLDPAPWSDAPAAARAVPRVYVTEWRKARNRATCPLLVFTDLGEGEGARPRRATFHGGWAIAYDRKGLPGTQPSGADCEVCGRSAFGIAGTGVEKGGGPPWPNELRWADGSHAGYGPEGGVGRRSLAYLSIEGADCLYNVWSALGEEHLVTLLQGLRRVEAAR
jgi:hypothetical protein